ncbi:GNAT family N-acetyltransferase [Candidatus Micrarchaeota archaeon]|nr:GNAT family N-acetyltransferase [Candidatus Micrarchaeota archaeon]
MKHTLKDGRTVETVPLSDGIPTESLLEYINALIGEDGYLRYDRKFDMGEQEKWKEETLRKIKDGKELYFAAIHDGRIIGSISARKGEGREEGNVSVGIAISKGFRGEGLGEMLIREIIREARDKLSPKNLFLYAAAPNSAAISLYSKVGFEEFARFPGWWERKGERIDVVWMLLKE